MNFFRSRLKRTKITERNMSNFKTKVKGKFINKIGTITVENIFDALMESIVIKLGKTRVNLLVR